MSRFAVRGSGAFWSVLDGGKAVATFSTWWKADDHADRLERQARKEVVAGEGSPALKLRHIHKTEDEAKAAATAKLREITRGNDTFEASFPGDPLIAAEGRILTAGFRSGVNGLWSIKTATHTLDGGGFSTAISAERPGAD